MYSIEVKNVSKKFRIYHDKSLTLKERLLFWNRTKYEEHQVLKDINLKIEKGKTVGLIGQNGSGKSTLLKLLTQIIYPDAGEIIINGKVSSLLELGAGFHPDFSGRENIYTNASIFGLSRDEIDRRFDKIVEFSELGEFIDNPVRTYSSGMYMRLAFSVAINVDADILLIDEILAVGDANFQKKCMDNIKELKKNGVTIVIVTHDMSAVQRICNQVAWLEAGQLREYGDTFDVVNSYMDFMGKKQINMQENTKNEIEQDAKQPCIDNEEPVQQIVETVEECQEDDLITSAKNRWGSKEVLIERAETLDERGLERKTFKCQEKIIVRFKYKKINKEMVSPVFGIGIFRNDGLNCFGTNTQIERVYNIRLKNEGEIKCEFEKMNLLEGHYFVDLAVVSEDGFPYDYLKSICEFDIFSDIKDIGVSRLDHRWYIDGKYINQQS